MVDANTKERKEKTSRTFREFQRVSPLHVGEIYVKLSNSFYIEVQPVYENRDANPNERTCTCVPFQHFKYVQPLLVFFLLLLISVGI